ncbi:Gag protein [Phytophthora palmivora]|uniref:Gag protein n=1 Tax=Phytophthora palmivora TaxID=4796 RepID=A0A2P4XVI3_9STRA|nr:Gag protein [Phytophthora palmivora]
MDSGEFSHLTDAQFESVWEMADIFGGDALRSLAAATPAEQVKRIEAFNTYEAAFLPANYECRQRSRFLACKQGKRELHEYIQEMRVLAASLVGNPLPEHIKVTVFMDGLKVDPSRTQLFRVHANTMEETIQIALQKDYSHRQAYQYHVFDGVSGRQVKTGAVHLETLPEVAALLNIEELSMKDFLTELKAGDIAEMVFLKPETSSEDLNYST